MRPILEFQGRIKQKSLRTTALRPLFIRASVIADLLVATLCACKRCEVVLASVVSLEGLRLSEPG